MKSKGRGGKRPGAGRPRSGNVEICITVDRATLAKIDRAKRLPNLWKGRGKIICDLMRGIHIPGLEYLDLSLVQ